MKKFTKILIACLLAALCGTAYGADAWQSNTGSYKSDAIGPDYQEKYLKFFKPLWTTSVKFSEDFQFPMTLTDGKFAWVGTAQGVKALKLQTGKQLWFTKVNDVQSFSGSKDKVFAVDKNGLLYAFDKATGKVKWTNKLAKGFVDAKTITTQDNLYIRWRNGFAKLDANTGKAFWKQNKSSAVYAGFPLLFGNVLLQSYVESGAITVTRLYAFDNYTGKELWKISVDREPLFRMGNQVYVQSTWFNLDSPEVTTIKAINLLTGKVVSEIKYLRSLFNTPPGVYSTPKKVVVSDGYVYIDVDNDIKKFYLGVDSAKFNASAKGIYSAGKQEWLAGPFNDIMLYNMYGILRGVSFDTDLSYQGVISPISNMEVINRAIIIAQSDGRVIGCDLLTGRNYFTAKTQARTYQAIKVIGNYLLIQGDGKLYVYSAPKLAALAREKTKPHYTKTTISNVKFLRGGKTFSLTKNVVMLSGNKMLPVQEFVSTLGGTAKEDKKNGKLTIKIDGKTAAMKLGDYYAELNGEVVGVNPAPQVIDGITYVPEKFINIMLGGNLHWDNVNKTYQIK